MSEESVNIDASNVMYALSFARAIRFAVTLLKVS